MRTSGTTTGDYGGASIFAPPSFISCTHRLCIQKVSFSLACTFAFSPLTYIYITLKGELTKWHGNGSRVLSNSNFMQIVYRRWKAFRVALPSNYYGGTPSLRVGNLINSYFPNVYICIYIYFHIGITVQEFIYTQFHIFVQQYYSFQTVIFTIIENLHS